MRWVYNATSHIFPIKRFFGEASFIKIITGLYAKFYLLFILLKMRVVTMLRGIPKILSPDLVKYMMEMGHSDFLVLADANFPGSANAKRLVRMDSGCIPEMLEAILSLYPLDTFVTDTVKLMRNLPSEPIPEVWETYRSIIIAYDKDEAFTDFVFLDRLDFYEITQNAYVVVQTGDTSRYGNIILQKGVC